MASISFSVDNFFDGSDKNSFLNIQNNIQNIDWPRIDLSNIQLPTIDFSNIDIPTINLPNIDASNGTIINSSNQTFVGSNGNDNLVSNGHNNTLNGGAGDDIFAVNGRNSTINGGIGDDNITSNGRRNVITGGDGNDTLIVNGALSIVNGNDGNDTLVGGNNVRLFGGAGADTFGLVLDQNLITDLEISSEDGFSVIEDFQEGQDRLRLPNLITASISGGISISSRLVSFEELTITQQGQNTEIRFADEKVSVLTGIQANQITAEDFTAPDSLTGLLEPAQYLASHNDLIVAFGYDLEGAKQHYEETGRFENRALDTFDELNYLASHGDLIQTFGFDLAAATEHYISAGASEGRVTTLFDPASYLNNYGDLQAAFGNDLARATQHYIEAGFAEGRIY